MPINWCPVDKVGLANEEVINGHCERCGAEVIRRRISQWVVKITAYADRLIDGLKQTDFIEKVKAAQINWIGKSVGARIYFPIKGRPGKARSVHHPSGYAVGSHLHGAGARASPGQRVAG